MPQNLFAACRINGELIAKRIRLDATVQGDIESIFQSQERDFRTGVTEEIHFDGSWKPDTDEFLTIDIPAEAEMFERAIRGNATAVPDIDIAHFDTEGIKALFTGGVNRGQAFVLVQRFTTRQLLSKNQLALLLHGNTFSQLTETAFTLDSKLTCIVEGGKIKFKSLCNLRSIIDMTDIYREATDDEVRAFGCHDNLHVADIQGFLLNTNQTSRKLIHVISGRGILNNYTPQQIQQAALPTGLELNIEAGKLVMPASGAQIKKVLQFLDESRYLGPLSQQPYVTNSHTLVNRVN